MLLHGLFDHDPSVEDLLQHLRQYAALQRALEEDDSTRRDVDVIAKGTEHDLYKGQMQTLVPFFYAFFISHQDIW